MARITLGVTGGIAAYKACELVRLLVKAGHDVTPITTRGAEEFVAAQTLWALARKEPGPDPYLHLSRADALVVAPLTAHTLARLAHGLADDLLTQTALAHDGPMVVAPAMNPRMWEHPATRAEPGDARRTRRARGRPRFWRAGGRGGRSGRMSEPEEIAMRIEELLTGTSAAPGSRLRGLVVVVTAGGTREPLDDVRYLGNRSSGRMGVALANGGRAPRRRCDIARRQPPRPGTLQV